MGWAGWTASQDTSLVEWALVRCGCASQLKRRVPASGRHSWFRAAHAAFACACVCACCPGGLCVAVPFIAAPRRLLLPAPLAAFHFDSRQHADAIARRRLPAGARPSCFIQNFCCALTRLLRCPDGAVLSHAWEPPPSARLYAKSQKKYASLFMPAAAHPACRSVFPGQLPAPPT